MRVVFMGTPDFAVPTLERLVKSDHDVISVVTRPDAQRGRGRKLQPPEVKVAAEVHGLEVFQPESLKDEDFQGALRQLKPDLFVVVAFLILPKSLLAIPKHGSINLHPSLLPRYRGAAPINWAVINGESETGISTFLLQPRVDAGDILIQKRVPVGENETAGELHERLKVDGADVVVETVDRFAEGSLSPKSQDDREATPAPKLTKETARVDWSKSAAEIRNLIRGTNPFPGAFTEWKNGILKLHSASLTDCTGTAGQVLSADPKSGLVVATGEGALRLDTVQPQGKKAMDGAALVLGYNVDVGDQLS
ncbi:TPA: methionyl-tRNA formyltransferase [Candidatus Latescibacteria bacterium]|nr:methionyl-tRNA formyltransferase [Candidatus Latescibacterota bacterium]